MYHTNQAYSYHIIEIQIQCLKNIGKDEIKVLLSFPSEDMTSITKEIQLSVCKYINTSIVHSL